MICRSPRNRLARSFFLTLSTLLLCSALPAGASIIGYQSKAAFDTASAGWTTTLTNFDSLAAGTTYADGSGPAGSGFTLSLAGPDAGTAAMVSNEFWTTSGSNYLGLNNGDQALEQGDTLTFTFAAPVRAFGLYAIGTSDVMGGDFTLATGADSISNSSTASITDLASGSYAYFLGFTADGGDSFTSASFNVGTRSVFLGLPTSLDDIVLAAAPTVSPVPEPGSVVLLLGGLLACGAVLRRRVQR